MLTANRISAPPRAYSEMLSDIHQSLSSGALTAGDCLPSEAALGERYSISINSVRRGIDTLVKDGVVERRRGSGTYVRKVPDVPQARVARDVIALLLGHGTRSYHPFFSERLRGLRLGLRELGWQTWAGHDAGPSGPTADYVWDELDFKTVASEFAARGIAGAVIGRSEVDNLLPHVRTDFPLVTLGDNPDVPFVGYDWQAELSRGITEVVRAGCRRLLVFSRAFDANSLQSEVQRVASLVGPGSDSVEAVLHETNISRFFSQWINEAHQAALSLLEQHPETDGIVVGSDLEAQGVLDAVAEKRAQLPDNLRIAAVTNKESRIHTALPYTAIVIDGFHLGQAAAKLLHDHITFPEHAHRQIWLSGSVHS